MWEVNYSKVFKNVTKAEVWAAWADVNHWTLWDKELEEVWMTGPFSRGTEFSLKPKGGPKVSIVLTDVKELKSFTDATKFPLARMMDHHEMEDTPDGLKISNWIWTEGLLAWVWRKIVAENVAAGVPAQLESLVEYVERKKQTR